jgi:hypothetical protein
VNLRWDASFQRFIAEFSDFNQDLAAVKAAGFKTEGAPQWIWHSYKAEPLHKLKGTPGLTITPEARKQYTALWAVEENNAKVKAELASHKKALQKKLKIEKADIENPPIALKMCELGFMAVSTADLPAMPPFESKYTPASPPELKCIICAAPVYFYEKQDPPVCLWDEKIVLDNISEVC